MRSSNCFIKALINILIKFHQKKKKIMNVFLHQMQNSLSIHPFILGMALNPLSFQTVWAIVSSLKIPTPSDKNKHLFNSQTFLVRNPLLGFLLRTRYFYHFRCLKPPHTLSYSLSPCMDNPRWPPVPVQQSGSIDRGFSYTTVLEIPFWIMEEVVSAEEKI